MAKSKTVKTNNIAELLKSKGIAPEKKKANDRKIVPRETSRRRLYDLVSEDLGGNSGELKPVETSKGHLEPVSSIQTEKPPVIDLKPVETTKHQLEPVSNAKEILQANEHRQEDLKPVETTKNQLNPIETIKTQLKPIEPSKDHLEPIETTTNRFQPVETSSKESHELVSKGSIGFQVDSVKPVKAIKTLLARPVETGSNRFQNLPSISELHVLIYLKNLNGNGTKKPLIAQGTGLKVAGVKTALSRLKTKGFINLVGYSGGCANSFTVYELTEMAVEFLSSEKANSLLAFGDLKPVSTGFSYSSSINKTITTEKKEESERFFIPERIQEFTNSNQFLKYLGPLTLDEIQESIENFSFDFGNGLLPKSENPLRILYGQLKKGETYNSFKRVETEKQMMAEVKKRNDEAAAANVELKKEQFKEWQRNNPEKAEELLSGAPPEIMTFPVMKDNYKFDKWKKMMESK